jgi:hypothetical protein
MVVCIKPIKNNQSFFPREIISTKKSEKAKDFPKNRQKHGIKAGIGGAGNRMNP